MSARKVSRRAFLKAAGLGAAGVALAACQPQTKAVEAEQIEISMRHDPNEKFRQGYADAAAEFQEIHPNITIVFDDSAAPQGGYIPWMAAGTAPDMFRTAINEGPSFGLTGMVHDVAPHCEKLDIIDKFIPAIWDGFKYKDSVYSVPNDANTLLLWSNPVLYEEAGVADLLPPKTWDDVVKVCEAVTVKDPDPTKAVFGYAIPTTIGWSGFFFWFWLWRFGGDFVTDDTYEILFDSPECREALEALRFLVAEEYLPAIDNWDTPFFNGRCASYEYGSWAVPRDVPGEWNDFTPKGPWTADYEQPNFVLSEQVQLKEGVPNYSVFAGFSQFLPRLTNLHPQETVEWIWYTLTTDPYGSMWLRIGNQLLCTTVYSDPWLEEPAWAVFMKQLETTKPLGRNPAQLQFDGECVNPNFMKAWLGEMEIEEAIAKAVECAEPICEEYRNL